MGLASRAAFEKQLTVARNRAAQQVVEHTLAARNLGNRLVAASADQLRAAEFIELGKLSMNGNNFGVNERVSVPCIVPLLGRSNLTVVAGREQSQDLARHLVHKAFTETAAGELDVIVFDPLLTGVMSPFAPVQSSDQGALNIINSASGLDTAIDHLAATVQRVKNTMRGVHDNLLDFRAHTGRPVERLGLVVLADYPEAVSEAMHARIMSLAAVAPSSGISFIFLPATATQPSWMTRADFRGLGEVIESTSGVLRWGKHPEFELDVPAVDSHLLATEVDSIARSIATASVTAIPFSTIQPSGPEWLHSSADGLTFSVGVSGPDPAHITLGNETEQRHNALITGAVGQGKSNLLKVIIHSLCERYSPDELEMYLLDFKEGVTLYPLAPSQDSPDFLPHARVLGIHSDREFGLAVFRHLVKEFSRRAALFKPHGDNIAKYRAAVPQARMPRIVVIVDEFHMLFEDNDETATEAAALLQKMCKLGRAYGVHVILSSQSISGIAALMATGDGIFAQFPIRLALKNSSGESQATLGMGNDAAARLRVRGQAVLNLDYGAVDGNRQVVIAAAEDAELNQLRTGWWHRSRSSAAPPVVFDGTVQVRPGTAAELIRSLRRTVLEHGATPAAVVGLPIDVTSVPLAIPMGHEPGRHLALVGSGQRAPVSGDEATSSNVAVGTLQTAALSLALQHPEGDAEFISFDLLDPMTSRQNNQDLWYTLMERLGFPVRRISRDSVNEELRSIAQDLAEPSGERTARYLIGFAFDRATGMDTPDMFSRKASEDLQMILRDGPNQSVHVLSWWANAATFGAHMGYGGSAHFDAFLLLGMDLATAQTVLGPFVKWSVRDNRGLLVDRTQRAEAITVVPFASLTSRDSATLLAADWGN